MAAVAAAAATCSHLPSPLPQLLPLGTSKAAHHTLRRKMPTQCPPPCTPPCTHRQLLHPAVASHVCTVAQITQFRCSAPTSALETASCTQSSSLWCRLVQYSWCRAGWTRPARCRRCPRAAIGLQRATPSRLPYSRIQSSCWQREGLPAHLVQQLPRPTQRQRQRRGPPRAARRGGRRVLLRRPPRCWWLQRRSCWCWRSAASKQRGYHGWSP
jgi:hypothetical protein